MNRAWLIAASGLAACVAHPTGLELQFEPIAPGADHIDLYLGTTEVDVSSDSLDAPGQVSVETTHTYARDTPLSYGLDLVATDKLLDVEAPAGFPAVGELIAIEYDLQGNQIAGAALTGITASRDRVTNYKVQLQKITNSGPIVDGWGPAAPANPGSDFHGDDHCAYYADESSSLLLVVARVTGAAVGDAFVAGGYSDFDCDGYAYKSDLECNDNFFDSAVPPSLDNASCLEEYTTSATASCRATAPTCVDGKQPETTCPAPIDLTASNLASYCLPDSECATCSTYPGGSGLDCLTSGYSQPYMFCDFTIDKNSDACTEVTPTLPIPHSLGMSPSCASNGIIPYATVGLPGAGFDTTLTIGELTIAPSVDAAACDAVAFDVSGTWSNATSGVTFLLALTPPNGLGMILPVTLDPSPVMPPDACPTSTIQTLCTLAVIGDDDSVTRCVQDN